MTTPKKRTIEQRVKSLEMKYASQCAHLRDLSKNIWEKIREFDQRITDNERAIARCVDGTSKYIKEHAAAHVPTAKPAAKGDEYIYDLRDVYWMRVEREMWVASFKTVARARAYAAWLNGQEG